MKKSMIYRVLIYIAGLLILAMGLTLNTKAGLGVSPIISVSYSVSEITHHNFGNTTLVLYTIFVILELVLHNIREKQYEKRVEKSLRETENGTEDLLKHANWMNRKLIFVMDILQIPLSIVFTRFLNVFSSVLPAFPEGNMTAPVMASCPALYRNRCSNVFEYADCPESWRWNRTGDCGLYSQKCRIYEELF